MAKKWPEIVVHRSFIKEHSFVYRLQLQVGSNDSDQDTQIDFSKPKTKTKTGLGVAVKEKFSHLDQFLQYCCNKTECNFKTKSPEDFEAHFKFNSRNFSNH